MQVEQLIESDTIFECEETMFVGKIKPYTGSNSYFSKVESILQKINLYLGSTDTVERNARFFISDEIYDESTRISKAVENSFNEILNNACQYSTSSEIIVTMNSDSISIENECDIQCIPFSTTDHTKLDTYTDLIFDNIDCSSFHNSMGARLTNITSKEFIVEVGDNNNGVHQRIVWRNNMREKESSVCTPSYVYSDGEWKLDETIDRYTGKNFIRVTWKQDFSCGGTISSTKDSYSEKDISFYAAKLVDASFSHGKTIIFNGKLIDYRNMVDYASLFTDEDETIFYSDDYVSLAIFDNIGGYGSSISSVNGLQTSEGGVHVNVAYKSILDLLISSFPDKDFSNVSVESLKKNISIIIKYNCSNAIFRNVTKDNLLSPKPFIVLDISAIDIMKKWESFIEIMN